MRIRVIVDTDPGIDDAYALAVAATDPEAELLAVTTTFGNAPIAVTTGNAQRVLTLVGRQDVPVGKGAGRPLVLPAPDSASEVHGTDGLGGRAADFGALGEPVEVRALDVLVRVLESAPGPVVIAAIGPLTNIALLLAVRPDLEGAIDRIVVMGGALSVPGNATPAAEYNLLCDPEAARRVLAHSSVPVTLVPLDVTHRCTVDEAWLDRLAASGPASRVLAGTRETYLRYYRHTLHASAIPLHDAVAVLEAVRPGSVRTTGHLLDVDTSTGPTRGALVADRRPARRDVPPCDGEPTPRPVDVALDTDVDHVRTTMLERLRRVG